MGQIQKMRYSETLTCDIIKERRFSTECLADLLRREGACHPSIPSKSIINLDDEERRVAKHEKRNNRPTVDFYFAVTSGQLRLAECKYKCKKDLNSLSKTELDKKNQHSTSLLGQEVPIYQGYILLVADDMVAQVISYLSRYYSRNKDRLISAGIQVMTTADFIKEYF